MLFLLNYVQVTSFTYRKSDRKDGIEFYTLVTQGSVFPSRNFYRTDCVVGRLLTFHRADFQKVLLVSSPPSHRIHCSKRLRSYTQRQGGAISLLFEDGTAAKCDVLLGADGLKSAVRRSLLGEKVQWAQGEGKWSEAADLTAVMEPCWSGTNAYRALIPADKLKMRYPNHRVLTQPTQVSLRGRAAVR
jgi:salicylate hydroxylase